MSLPKPLRRLVTKPRFWTDLLWVTEPDEDDEDEGAYPALQDFTWCIRFREHALRLSLDEDLVEATLDVQAGDGDPAQLGWDDQAHWHPHVLRWEELDLICRAAAVLDPKLVHPGPLLLLLHRFAPICEGDDVDHVFGLLGQAWADVGFGEEDTLELVELRDARGAGFRWREDAASGRWFIEQAEASDSAMELYTLRREDNPEFPFAALDGLLAEARAIVEAAPSRGAKPARAKVKKAPQPRRKHHLTLELPMRDPDRPRPESVSKLLRDTLDAVLSALRLGSCDFGVSTMCKVDGEYVAKSSSPFVEIKGDLQDGLDILRGLLRWARVPETTGLRDAHYSKLDLGLRDAPRTGSVYLELAKVRTTPIDVYSGHRFDRVELDSKQLRILRKGPKGVRLTDEGDGWRAATLPDGGRVRIHTAKRKPTGAVVEIERLTADAATLVYDLAHAARLLVLPAALATCGEASQMIDAPWPQVRLLEDPRALLDILERGDLAWWLDDRDHSDQA